MSAYKIKLCGVPDVDTSSLKSMMKLSHNLLTHAWEFTDSDKAELTIYSFETDDGKQLWQQRDIGKSINAVLTSHGNITETVDVILKKPLRTKNFSDALNLVEDKISFGKQAQKVSELAKSQKQAAEAEQKTNQENNNKPSMFSKFSKLLGGGKGPAADLPTLNIHLPNEPESLSNTISEPELLIKWLKSIEDASNVKKVSSLLGNLQPLNRVNIAATKRIELLELYRAPIQQLVHRPDLAMMKESLDSRGYQESIKSIKLLMEELAIGYKHIIKEFYQKGDKPSTNKLFLLSIIRMTEQLSLKALYSYQHYLSAPDHTFYDLNQFYLYLEADKTLKLAAEYKTVQAENNFFNLYSQIMLTAIADPYRLARFDVQRLYRLMEKMAVHVEIDVISQKEIKINSSLLMTGHYCIDCEADYHATPMSKTDEAIKEKPTTRLFNTQPVLLAIEQIFVKTAQAPSHGAFDLDVKILKKIIPQLNTSYERKFDRKPPEKNITINIANGTKKIHDSIKDQIANNALAWKVHNQHQNGIMLSRDCNGLKQIDNGDFVAVFVKDRPPMLGVIRWLNIDNNNTIFIGLELFDGQPVSIICTSEEGETILALLSPASKEIKQDSTIIADKGVYSPGRRLRISGDGDPYIISADSLVDNTFNYEQFTYKKYKLKSE